MTTVEAVMARLQRLTDEQIVAHAAQDWPRLEQLQAAYAEQAELLAELTDRRDMEAMSLTMSCPMCGKRREVREDSAGNPYADHAC